MSRHQVRVWSTCLYYSVISSVSLILICHSSGSGDVMSLSCVLHTFQLSERRDSWPYVCFPFHFKCAAACPGLLYLNGLHQCVKPRSVSAPRKRKHSLNPMSELGHSRCQRNRRRNVLVVLELLAFFGWFYGMVLCPCPGPDNTSLSDAHIHITAAFYSSCEQPASQIQNPEVKICSQSPSQSIFFLRHIPCLKIVTLLSRFQMFET